VEEGQGEGVGREEADGGMGAEGVVFVFPVVDEEACFCDGMEPVLVRQSSRKVPLKLSMKAFCMGWPDWIWLRWT